MPLLAGERSDAFVSAARKAYAADPMCRTTVVTNFVVKGTPDDNAPGLVRWYDVEGARNVRDIGGWTGLRAGRVFRGTELNSKPNHKQYELTERGRAVLRRRNSETWLPFALMVRLISTFPGEAFADKVAYWAENVAGLTKDEIARIRANLVNAPGAAKAADL